MIQQEKNYTFARENKILTNSNIFRQARNNGNMKVCEALIVWDKYYT
jgi:hypothetical protein